MSPLEMSLGGVTSAQLTDCHLLAMAVRHHARFLTLDRRIDPALVPDGAAVYVRLGQPDENG